MTKTGSKAWDFKADSEIKAVRISDKGAVVVAVSRKGTLYYLNNEGKLVWKADLGSEAQDLDLAYDGGYVAAATKDKKLHFYDKRGKLHWKLGLKAPVTSVSMSSTGTLNAVGTLKGTAYLVDRNGKVHWSFKASAPIRAVALSAKGTYMAVGSDDHVINYLDSRGGLRWKYTAQGRVHALKVDANGDYVLASVDDKRIYFFDRHGSLVWNPRNPETSRTLDMSSSAGNIIVGTGNEVALFSKDGGLLRRWSGKGHITSVAMAKSGDYGIAGTTSDSLHFLSVSGDHIWEFKTLDEVTSVAVSSPGDYVVAGTRDKSILFFDNNVFYKDYIEEAKRKLMAIKKSGINILEAEVLLQRAELELKRNEYSSAINYAIGAEKVAGRIREKTRPEVSMLSVIYESTALNQATKVNTIIMNTGSMHAKEVRLDFAGPYEVRGEKKFSDLKVNKFFETHFFLIPQQAGNTQLKVKLLFVDYEGKEYMAEGTITLTVDQAKKTRFSKSKAIVQIGNIPKLYKRVQAAKTGKAGKVKKAPKPVSKHGKAAKSSSVTVRCPGCGKPVQKKWAGCPYCMTKLK